MRPEKYILNSDYATLANDSDTATITFNITNTSIGSGVTQTFTGTGTVGKVGSPIEYDVNYSLSARRWKTPELLFVENAGTANQYQGTISVFKSDATTVMVSATIFNGTGSPITKNARTVTVRVRTFVPPFA